MNDFISRREAIEKIKEEGILGSGYSDTEREDDVIHMINDILAADVQPVKRGKWILIDDDTVHGKCSECGFECHYYEDDVFGMPFCPNCGAVMSTDE